MHNHGLRAKLPPPVALRLHGSRATPLERRRFPPGAAADVSSLTMAPQRVQYQRQRRGKNCARAAIVTVRAAALEPVSAPLLALCADHLLLIAGSLYAALAAGLMALPTAREQRVRRIGPTSPLAYRRLSIYHVGAHPRPASLRPRLVAGRLVLAAVSSSVSEPSVRRAWAAAAAMAVRLRCANDVARCARLAARSLLGSRPRRRMDGAHGWPIESVCAGVSP